MKQTLLIIFLALPLLTISADEDAAGNKAGLSDPLVNTAISGDIKALKKIADESSDLPDRINRPDNNGRTPLMWVCYLNNTDPEEHEKKEKRRVAIVSYLAEKGAKLDVRDNDGWTPLLWAVWSDMPSVASALLEKGAGHSIQGKNGFTPLILASYRGAPELVDILIKVGADTTVKNKNGNNALQAAKKGKAEHPDNTGPYDTVISKLKK